MTAEPLLMPYVQCPECQHLGADHPRRSEAEIECIGGYRGQTFMEEDYLVTLPQRCGCNRNRIGR